MIRQSSTPRMRTRTKRQESNEENTNDIIMRSHRSQMLVRKSSKLMEKREKRRQRRRRVESEDDELEEKVKKMNLDRVPSRKIDEKENILEEPQHQSDSNQGAFKLSAAAPAWKPSTTLSKSHSRNRKRNTQSLSNTSLRNASTNNASNGSQKHYNAPKSQKFKSLETTRRIQRKRGESSGSESEASSEDEIYPHEAKQKVKSAFSDKLTFLSPQKRIPKTVNREVVIDIIFSALFARNNNTRGARALGDDIGTGTDTDEPNEEFVKRGLAMSVFKDNPGVFLPIPTGFDLQKDTLERYITSSLVHSLITDLRFEDFRTTSARIDILRAIHKNIPIKRLDISRALVDAAFLRFQYVQALNKQAQRMGMEFSKAGMIVHNVVRSNSLMNDHGHGFTELLRYALEHIGESANGFSNNSTSFRLTEQQNKEITLNYTRILIFLWQTHWIDSVGSDEDELISCAGQFVAYIPSAAIHLVKKILHNWPTRYPTHEVNSIRMLARVLMASRRLDTLHEGTRLHIRAFHRLASCIRGNHIQVAQEAMAFVCCQFALVNYISNFHEIYTVVSKALHENSRNHWSETVRVASESNFDRMLDFA